MYLVTAWIAFGRY